MANPQQEYEEHRRDLIPDWKSIESIILASVEIYRYGHSNASTFAAWFSGQAHIFHASGRAKISTWKLTSKYFYP